MTDQTQTQTQTQTPDLAPLRAVITHWEAITEAVLAHSDPYDLDHLDTIHTPGAALAVLLWWTVVAADPEAFTAREYDRACEDAAQIHISANALAVAYLP